VSRADVAGQAKAGVKPGTVQWRAGGGYDPDWYLEGPAPDEAAFQATLEALPANVWTKITGKETRFPPRSRGWGTAAYDPDRQAIYVYGGGHSYHCGTDVPAFSMRTGRWHIKYPPAFPLEWNGANAGSPLDMSFMGQPFVPGHSYHSYAYDPAAKVLFCCGNLSLYPYDPDSGLWRPDDPVKGMTSIPSGTWYTLTLCSTPRGARAWLGGKLFRHDDAQGGWTEVAVSGEKLPNPECDDASMCYDSKRGRLLLIAGNMNGGLMAVDLKTSVATRLAPKGMARFGEYKVFLREICYDEANDLMIVDKRAAPGKGDAWLVYDCAKNAWVTLKLPGRPVSPDSAIAVSSSLMYDSARKLVLSLNTYTLQVHALRLDPKSAEPRELE
jgi:hypothetical protein